MLTITGSKPFTIGFFDLAGSEKILLGTIHSQSYNEGSYIIKSLSDFSRIFKKYTKGEKIDMVGLEGGISMYKVIDFMMQLNKKSDSFNKNIIIFTSHTYFTNDNAINDVICKNTQDTFKVANTFTF